MLFNSWKFFFFFLIVFSIYWLLGRKKQNLFLLACSYLFYSAWDYRFLLLLLGTSVWGFYCGKKIHDLPTQSGKKTWMVLSVIYNIGTLAVFKYYGFFSENLVQMLGNFGVDGNRLYLNFILPIGISFFNFHALSYTIDLYRKEIKPCPSFIDFALFIAFFPLLIAGPIERAQHLLPQIQASRKLSTEEISKGMWLFFWGLWKKVFVAENLSLLVDNQFDHSRSIGMPALYLSLIAFAFQIYCDFSGYTDMARGCSKLLGFDLLKNFNLPYFATNPSDFWKRWHISLSSWLRDYLYISLGGNRGGKIRTYRNLFLTMAIGGLWHGAAWNYEWWGIYQGLLLIGFHFISERFEFKLNKWVSMALMFQFTLFGWMLFRANRTEMINGVLIDRSSQQILELLGSIHRGFVWDPTLTNLLRSIVFIVAPLLLIQFFQFLRRNMYFVLDLPPALGMAIKAALLFLLTRYGIQSGNAFIYFQF